MIDKFGTMRKKKEIIKTARIFNTHTFQFPEIPAVNYKCKNSTEGLNWNL